MGVHSTVDITRRDAITEIIARVTAPRTDPEYGATDEAIAAALFALAGDKTFHNFHIVDRYAPGESAPQL